MKLSNFKWYRRLTGGTWYKHENTFQLPGLWFDFFWTKKYGQINRFTRVVDIEEWQ